MIDDAIELLTARSFPGVEPPDPGPRPTFEWVPKSLIRADRRYQRSADGQKSRKLISGILEGFTWAKFSPLTVVEIEDRQYGYAVVDGQHRALAALAHPQIEEVPCWVLPPSTVKQQAKAFVGINRDRNSISAVELFRSQLAAGDPDALQVDSVCRSANVRVVYYTSNGVIPARSTIAVTMIRRLIFQHGEGPVREALRALADANPEETNQLTGQVIAGVVGLLVEHRKRVDAERLHRVLVDQDTEDLLKNARSFKNLMGGTTIEAITAALVKSYDKGLPEHRRLVPKSTESTDA